MKPHHILIAALALALAWYAIVNPMFHNYEPVGPGGY